MGSINGLWMMCIEEEEENKDRNRVFLELGCGSQVSELISVLCTSRWLNVKIRRNCEH